MYAGMHAINRVIPERLLSREGEGVKEADAALREALQAQLSKHRIAGAAIAVHHRGRVRTAAAGLANVAAGIEVDDRTIFQIGSITKVFTAALMVLLAERGQVELDAPVTRYLPALRIDRQPAPAALTVRTLLDYTAGMEGDFFRDFGRGADAIERYVQACAALTWVHEPGRMRSYNSTAYCIAGRVIEVVTGLAYDEALARHLLDPLGLECRAFYREDVARFRTAVGHLPDGAGGLRLVEHLRLPHCMSPAGASVTLSARDLLRFGLMQLHDGVAENGQRLFSAPAARALRASTGTVPPHRSERIMGWATLETDQGPMTAASGRTIEQNAFLALLPGHDFACAVLANTGNGAQQIFLDLGAELLKAATGATISLPAAAGPPAALGGVSEAQAPDYAGRYRNSYELELRWRDGALHGTMAYQDSITGQPIEQRFELRRESGERLWAVMDGQPASLFEFLRDEAGEVRHVVSAGRLYRRQAPG